MKKLLLFTSLLLFSVASMAQIKIGDFPLLLGRGDSVKVPVIINNTNRNMYGKDLAFGKADSIVVSNDSLYEYNSGRKIFRKLLSTVTGGGSIGDTVTKIATHRFIDSLTRVLGATYLTWPLKTAPGNDSTIFINKSSTTGSGYLDSTDFTKFIAAYNKQIVSMTFNAGVLTLIQNDGSNSISVSGIGTGSGGGSSYTFQYSLLNTAGVVNLVGDVSAPGGNKVYGTNPSGVRQFLNAVIYDSAGILNNDLFRWNTSAGTLQRFTLNTDIIPEGTSNKFLHPSTISSVTDTTTYKPIVIDASGNLRKSFWFGTGGTGGSGSYTFQYSLVNSGGVVNLVGDVASPGNNKVYSTNGSGTRVWGAAAVINGAGQLNHQILWWNLSTTQYDPVTLNTDIVPEGSGSNVYWSAARFNTAFAGKTTDNLTEGTTNTYFSVTRARAALNVSGGATGQVLKKNSATDFDYSWQADATGGTTGSYVNNGTTLQTAASFNIDGTGSAVKFHNSNAGQASYLENFVNTTSDGNPQLKGFNNIVGGSNVGLQILGYGYGSTLNGIVDVYAVQPDGTAVLTTNRAFNVRTNAKDLFYVLGSGNAFLPNGTFTVSALGGHGSGIIAVDNTGTMTWLATPSGSGGSVSSVNAIASGPLAFTGGPITNSGTFNLGWTGASTQYVLGDGTLATKITATSQLSNNSGYVVYSAPTLQLGSTTATATSTPVNIDLTGTFSSVAGTNFKLKLYNDGSSIIGLGVSSNQLDYGVPTGASHVFYIAGTEKLRIGTTLITPLPVRFSSQAGTGTRILTTDASGNIGNIVNNFLTSETDPNRVSAVAVTGTTTKTIQLSFANGATPVSTTFTDLSGITVPGSSLQLLQNSGGSLGAITNVIAPNDHQLVVGAAAGSAAGLLQVNGFTEIKDPTVSGSAVKAYLSQSTYSVRWSGKSTLNTVAGTTQFATSADVNNAGITLLGYEVHYTIKESNGVIKKGTFYVSYNDVAQTVSTTDDVRLNGDSYTGSITLSALVSGGNVLFSATTSSSVSGTQIIYTIEGTGIIGG